MAGDLVLDTCIAVLPSGNLTAVAASAQVNSMGLCYRREGNRRRLTADLHSRAVVWLCATH